MELVTHLDKWFADRLDGLRCREDTRAYVTGVLAGFKVDGDMMCRESVVLAYTDARNRGDFVAFQRIGDWVLWVDAMYPQFIHDNREVVESIGRLSYYTCHRIMRGQWHVYEELSDELPRLAYDIRHAIRVSGRQHSELQV